VCRLRQIRESLRKHASTLHAPSRRKAITTFGWFEKAVTFEKLQMLACGLSVQSQEAFECLDLELLPETLSLDPEQQLEDLVAPVQPAERLALGLAEHAHASSVYWPGTVSAGDRAT